MIRQTVVAFLTLSVIGPVFAGTWGQENYGEMYWGSNPVSAPTSRPTIQSIEADGESLIVTIADYAAGADGWSGIVTYTVTCEGAPAVVSSQSPVRVDNLAPETEYRCTVTAQNAVGSSPESTQVALTDIDLTGLNLVLLRAAMCQSSNPPTGC